MRLFLCTGGTQFCAGTSVQEDLTDEGTNDCWAPGGGVCCVDYCGPERDGQCPDG